jgi:hypothetical protein
MRRFLLSLPCLSAVSTGDFFDGRISVHTHTPIGVDGRWTAWRGALAARLGVCLAAEGRARRQCQSAFAGLVALRVSFLVAQSRGGCSSPIQRVPRGWTENICPSGRPVVDKRMKARKQKGGIPAGSAALAAVPRLFSAVSMKFKPNSTKVSQMSKASFSSAIPRNDTVSTQSSDTHPFGQPPSVALSQKPRPFEHLSSHSMARFFRVFWLQDAFRRRF